MRYVFGLLCVCTLGLMPFVGCGDTNGGGVGSGGSAGTGGVGGSAILEAQAAALESLQMYNQAFNNRDEEAWAATLNYPHVRFGGALQVQVWQTPEEYMAGFSFELFEAINPGWDHSEWDSIDLVQSGPHKVHAAIQFSRYDADGNVLGTYKTFHIMTQQNGHWGTQARSSYAE
jgi:hypothetical protein